MITWSVGSRQTHAVDDLVAFVGRCERHGIHGFWYGNEKLHPDMTVGLTVAALNSRRLRLGTFVADPYSVHPALTAAMVATLDHVSTGRAVLILGAGGSGLRELGLERRSPAAAVEEAVSVVRSLLRGEHVRREGPHFTLDTQLRLPPRPDLPIWVATRGKRMLEVAGRAADGVMIGTFARAGDVEAALRRVAAGAASAGRRLEELTVSVRVDVALADDDAAAYDVLRPFVAGILSASYPDRSFVTQAGLEVPEPLEEVCRTKDLALAWSSGGLVPDEFVEAFAWAGRPERVAERIAAVVDLGIEHVTVMFHPPPGERVEDQLDRFAAEVAPRVGALLGRSLTASEDR